MRQVVIAIDAAVWTGATEAQREAVLGIISAGGGGDTISPALWIDGNGAPWMVSAYWREHVANLTAEQIAALQAAARAALLTDRLHAQLTDDAAGYLAALGLHPQQPVSEP